MPILLKPCAGRLADELQQILTRNRDRAQWASYACEVCGTVVGAVMAGGKWIPEPHWPSVKYLPHGTEKRPAKSRFAGSKSDQMDAKDSALQ